MKRKASQLDVVAWGIVFMLVIAWSASDCRRDLDRIVNQPTPASIPAVVVDTGWHEALDAYGDFYFIDLPYSEMNDSQRDDANRLGRLYPSGHE